MLENELKDAHCLGVVEELIRGSEWGSAFASWHGLTGWISATLPTPELAPFLLPDVSTSATSPNA